VLKCVDIREHERNEALKSEIERATLQRRYLRGFAVPCVTVLLCCSLPVGPLVASETHPAKTVTVPMIEGRGIRFGRLPTSAGPLSQTRVSDIVQDDDGFIWFGRQNGLNCFDGYKCKVFRHDQLNGSRATGVSYCLGHPVTAQDGWRVSWLLLFAIWRFFGIAQSLDYAL
jgi:hypothetical protein